MATQRKSKIKCLAFFRGEVTCVMPGGIRIVKMWRPYKKDAQTLICDLKRNYVKGFAQGQLFEMRGLKQAGQPAYIKVRKWTMRPLTPRQMAKIEREVDEFMAIMRGEI